IICSLSRYSGGGLGRGRFYCETSLLGHRSDLSPRSVALLVRSPPSSVSPSPPAAIYPPHPSPPLLPHSTPSQSPLHPPPPPPPSPAGSRPCYPPSPHTQTSAPVHFAE